jgi:hypothetical protein
VDCLSRNHCDNSLAHVPNDIIGLFSVNRVNNPMDNDFTRAWQDASAIIRLLSRMNDWQSSEEPLEVGRLVRSFLSQEGNRNHLMNTAWHDLGGDFCIVEEMFRMWPREKQDLFIDQFSTMLTCVLCSVQRMGPSKG